MKRQSLSRTILAITICASISSGAQSQTWVCDVEASVGFDSSRGYLGLNFSTNKTYTIRNNINAEELTQELQRNHSVFNSSVDWFSPASLQQRGNNAVVLCTRLTHQGFSGGEVTRITCENTGYYGDKFEFNINTGRFSHVFTGFELLSEGQSWVEVGECRRTM
jgi:hypothetical protein